MQDLDKRVSALEELLIKKNLIDDKTFSDYEKVVTEDWVPNNGAGLVARAWLDPKFKEFLLLVSYLSIKTFEYSKSSGIEVATFGQSKNFIFKNI